MDVEFVSQSSHGHGSLRGRSRLGKYSTASGCRRRSPWPKSIDDAGKFIDDYQGVRIAKDGRRFRISSAVVWMVVVEGATHGQAALFPGVGAGLSRRLAPFKRRRASATLNSQLSTGLRSGQMESRHADKSPTVLIGWCTRNAGPLVGLCGDDLLANRDHRATPPA